MAHDETSGYQLSQRFCQRIQDGFGWMKTVGLLDKVRHRGAER